jgi:hypothetical protein
VTNRMAELMTFSRRKLITVIAVAFALGFSVVFGGNLAGQAAGSFIMTSYNSATSTNGGINDPHCIQHGAKSAFLCYYHEPGTGGGVYATLLLFENWYYWHPFTGDMVVDETYAKSGAPGFSTNTGHRTIHFADSHEVADGSWLANFPDNKTPPVDCSQAENDGLVQACTPAEQKSAMDFQHAITTDDPPHSY